MAAKDIVVNVEYDGLPDYWSGNGRRWDGNAGCLFASYGADTTWRDLISGLLDDYVMSGDFEGEVWADINTEQLEPAITNALRGYGYSNYREDEVCRWARELGENNGHDYDAPEDAPKRCDCCWDPSAMTELPQLILLVEIAGQEDENG